MTEPELAGARSASTSYRPDAAVVVSIGIVYLLLIPGAPHLDGIRWAESIARHEIWINPNYLLMQPLAMGGYRVWELLGGPADPALFAKVLDAFCATFALAFLAATLHILHFRFWVRVSCLLITAFSYNFLLLATSDHIKLVTAPFLFAALYLLVRFAREPSTRLAAAGGVAISLAVCTLVNAVVWGVLLIPAVWIIAGSGSGLRSRWRTTAAYCLGMGLPAMGIVLGFYAAEASDADLLSWLTQYAADPETRGDGFQGVSVITLGRFVFSVIKNFVYAPDLSIAVKASLIGGVASPTTPYGLLNAVAAAGVAFGLGTLVLASGLAVLRRDLDVRDRRLMWIVGSMLAAFVLFGFFWNDSDEEFWFQMTPPVAIIVGLAVARQPAVRWRAIVLGAVASLITINQLVSFAIPRALFPYEQTVAALADALTSCDWVLYDEDHHRGELMVGVRSQSSIKPESIMILAQSVGFDENALVAALDDRFERIRAQQGRICVVGIFESSDYQFPWTNLSERFAISRKAIISRLEEHEDFRRTEVVGQPVYISGELDERAR